MQRGRRALGAEENGRKVSRLHPLLRSETWLRPHVIDVVQEVLGNAYVLAQGGE